MLHLLKVGVPEWFKFGPEKSLELRVGEKSEASASTALPMMENRILRT